jgi:hypothetical protein
MPCRVTGACGSSSAPHPVLWVLSGTAGTQGTLGTQRYRRHAGHAPLDGRVGVVEDAALGQLRGVGPVRKLLLQLDRRALHLHGHRAGVEVQSRLLHLVERRPRRMRELRFELLYESPQHTESVRPELNRMNRTTSSRGTDSLRSNPKGARERTLS